MEQKPRRARGEGSVFLRSDRRWTGYVSIPSDAGKPKRKWFYGKDEAAVKARLERFKQQLGPVKRKHKPGRTSFETYALEWLWEQREYVKPRTLELYERELRTLNFPHIGELPLTAITSQHIRDMQATIAATGKRDSARRSRKSAYRILKSAVIDGHIPQNPAEGARPVKHKAAVKEIWTAAEVRAFLAAAEDHPYYALFYLALTTGLRPGELCALEWGDVDENQVYVRQTITRVKNRLEIGPPKTDAGERYVPLPEDARAVLDAYAPAQRVGYVFPSSDGTVMNLSNVRLRWFLPLLEKAGLKRTKLYTMRHAYASMQIAAGVDVAKLAKWMGHGSPNVTLSYYVHAFEQRDRQPGLTMDQMLGKVKPVQEETQAGLLMRPGKSGPVLEVRVSREHLEALLREAHGGDLTFTLGVAG